MKISNRAKLVYIANARLPGDWAHAIQIMKTCEAMTQNGLEVELITGFKRGSDEEIFNYFNIKNKFKITKTFCLSLSDTGAGRFNFLVRTFSFLLSARLRTAGNNYDILYFRNHLAALFFRSFYLEVHDLPPRIKFWHRLAFRKAKKIIVLTNFLKEKLIGDGVAAGKIVIAADGVDLEEFRLNSSKEQARQKLSLPFDKKIIAYSGNFSFHDWKGVDVLLESLKYFDDIYCLLIGGEEVEINEIKKRYQGKKLLITGRLPHNQIPLYLCSADALILPNKNGNPNSEYYTSPLKLFEYMASERPIVASDLPSLREVLNETNAVLVAPNSPEELAKGVKKALDRKDLSEKLVRQARLDVENFSWQKRAEKIIS